MLNKTLSPQVPTVIDIQLNNPVDTATYYARAVVSDKLSGAVLFTTNLVAKGNQYFSAPWTSPQDPTGNGRELLVATTIYTDAGYTSVSPAYGSTYDTWIIRSATQFYGGGGFGIDYDRIKDLIKKSWDEMPSTDIPETDLNPIQVMLRDISERLDRIEAQKVEEGEEEDEEEEGENPMDEVKEMLATHMTGVGQLLSDHSMKMQQIMGSLFSHHTEVLDHMRELTDSMDGSLAGSDEARQQHFESIKKILDDHKKDVLKSVDDAIGDFGKQPMEVRMFMPGEIARSKRPAAAEPAPKRPLENLLQPSNDRSR